MKFINCSLYLEFAEMVECGVNELYLRKAKSIGTSCWSFINDPKDARKVLVEYAKLKPVYQKMVNDRYGNPYDHVAREPILAMVVNDWMAHDWYLKYQYTTATGDEQKRLPIDAVNKYTRACGWLNMLNGVDRNKIKGQMGLGYLDFMEHVGKLIELEKERGKLKGYAGLDILPANFPGTYQRLSSKANEYANLMKSQGQDAAYQLLVDAAFGNKSAAKIGKMPTGNAPVSGSKLYANVAVTKPVATINTLETAGLLTTNEPENGLILPENDLNSVNKQGAFDLELYKTQMSVIRSVSGKYNNLDAGQVRKMVNILFEANGWKPVSVETIRKIIAENVHLLTAGRKGKRTHDTTVAMQLKRTPTQMPLMYWTLDGWTVELMYQERGAKGLEYKRMVAVIVLDAWKKYPIGYAIGERENVELIKAANRNALLHVRELFGKVYIPMQVQSDNYQIKNLTPFYQAMAKLHTPAAVGNAKAKVIEPYFKDLNKNYCQYQPNWSGFNVTAKKGNGVNVEMADKMKNTFPDKAGVVKQIHQIIARERAAKVAEYTGTWANMKPEHQREMGLAQWLEVMGEPIGATNRVTGQGLVKQIAGVKYVWDSFEPEFRAHMHLDWQILADSADLSKVLAVSPDGRMRFVLEEKRILPMDVLSMEPADHDYLKKVNGFNKQLKTDITDLYASDADTTRAVLANTPLHNLTDEAELDLKIMFTVKGQQKEKIQDAKGLGTTKPSRAEIQEARDEEAEWQARQEALFSTAFDFNNL